MLPNSGVSLASWTRARAGHSNLQTLSLAHWPRVRACSPAKYSTPSKVGNVVRSGWHKIKAINWRSTNGAPMKTKVDMMAWCRCVKQNNCGERHGSRCSYRNFMLHWATRMCYGSVLIDAWQIYTGSLFPRYLYLLTSTTPIHHYFHILTAIYLYDPLIQCLLTSI